MAETKTLLEQKAITLNSRAELVDDLQVEVASLKVQLDALNQVHVICYNVIITQIFIVKKISIVDPVV